MVTRGSSLYLVEACFVVLYRAGTVFYKCDCLLMSYLCFLLLFTLKFTYVSLCMF